MLCIPLTATASPFEVYGFGSRATSMGGAHAAAARDHSAIFYNPANLTLREKVHFGAALTFVGSSLSIEQQTDEPQSAVLPENNLGVSLGFCFPLGGLLDYRVAVGLALAIPLVQMTRLEAMDPARPQFLYYQSLPDHLVITPAIGFRVFDWLRFGAGVQILAAVTSDLQVTGDMVRRRIEERSLTVDLTGTTGPIFGIGSTLGPVQLGLTYRDDLELYYSIPVDLMLDGVGLLALRVDGNALYTPKELVFGVAVTLTEPALVIAADFTAAFWSNAPDPAAHVDAVLDDAELRPEEEEVAALFEFHTERADLGAQDIIIPRFGIEWTVSSILALRAGYYHRPTPFPDQTGYTSYLDCPANVFSLGMGASFPDPLQVHEEDMTIDLHIQWTRLMERITQKQVEDGATYEGTLIAGGDIWNIGLEFRQDF